MLRSVRSLWAIPASRPGLVATGAILIALLFTLTPVGPAASSGSAGIRDSGLMETASKIHVDKNPDGVAGYGVVNASPGQIEAGNMTFVIPKVTCAASSGYFGEGIILGGNASSGVGAGLGILQVCDGAKAEKPVAFVFDSYSDVLAGLNLSVRPGDNVTLSIRENRVNFTFEVTNHKTGGRRIVTSASGDTRPVTAACELGQILVVNNYTLYPQPHFSPTTISCSTESPLRVVHGIGYPLRHGSRVELVPYNSTLTGGPLSKVSALTSQTTFTVKWARSGP